MNENTRIVVCCYEGDAHQLYMPGYLQHGCPVTVLSPDDSRVVVPGADCQHAGKRAYIGQESLDRQRDHLKLLLSYPENFFLIHDSDSIMLDAKIPDYLYAEPDVVWSNQVNDDIPEHQSTFEPGWPHVAFQPPYFLSRRTIEAMLAVADDPRVQASPVMPFIDYYMVQLTMVAGLQWKRFEDCLSCPIAGDPRKKHSDRDLSTYELGRKIAAEGVAKGATILHSVKDPVVAAEFIEQRRKYLAPSVDGRLDLSKVTLVVVATRGHEMTRIAVRDCIQRARFGGVLIYTDAPGRVQIDGARYVEVPDWPNKVEAGKFYYTEAMAGVETPFGLLIEWDGGICDPSKWRNDFFEYDYVGAPWVISDNLKVGNGGFTLMSKRLGDFIYANRAEYAPCTTDWELCRTLRPRLEQAGGFRWAPVDVAADFAWELGPRSMNNFGYHGTFTWTSIIDRASLIERARAMTDDPYLLTKMYPLVRDAPWLQQAIGADAWSRYQGSQQAFAPAKRDSRGRRIIR